MLCSWSRVMYLEFGQAKLSHNALKRRLSRKGKLNLTVQWKRGLRTTGAISLLSSEQHMVWTPPWVSVGRGEGCRGQRLRSLARRGRADGSFQPSARWQVMGTLRARVPGASGGKQTAFQPQPFAVGLARGTGTLVEGSDGDSRWTTLLMDKSVCATISLLLVAQAKAAGRG